MSNQRAVAADASKPWECYAIHWRHDANDRWRWSLTDTPNCHPQLFSRKDDAEVEARVWMATARNHLPEFEAKAVAVRVTSPNGDSQ